MRGKAVSVNDDQLTKYRCGFFEGGAKSNERHRVADERWAGRLALDGFVSCRSYTVLSICVCLSPMA